MGDDCMDLQPYSQDCQYYKRLKGVGVVVSVVLGMYHKIVGR